MPIPLSFLVWVLAIGVVQRLCWRSKASVGLPIAFLASVAVIHIPGAIVHALPWYDRPTHGVVETGFALSALGALALAAGHAYQRRRARRRTTAPTSPAKTHEGARMGLRYLVLGLGIHLVVFPVFHGVATITAILSGGMTLAVCGLHLLIHAAATRGERRAYYGWVASACLFPLVTVLSGGFLGFGVAILMGTLCFVAGFDRPRWRPYLIALILLYPALSTYVSYMRDRGAIREVVWGRAPLATRLDVVAATIASPELFDPTDELHLRRFDERLNQNTLVGHAVEHMEEARVEFAEGRTFLDAVLGLIPRALWPDKPFKAGGASTVMKYTGLRFKADTSVGVGTVLELYINFGAAGVALGFAALGVVLSRLDERCGALLASGELDTFPRLYVVGLSLLGSAGNSFVEVGASLVGAVLLAEAVRRALPPVRHRGAR